MNPYYMQHTTFQIKIHMQSQAAESIAVGHQHKHQGESCMSLFYGSKKAICILYTVQYSIPFPSMILKHMLCVLYVVLYQYISFEVYFISFI